ncbi:MAG: hypothetical protein KJ052_06020 [Candidatus Hydrogenedentes bacterium]|nr:hypothetical protein [Candidatus Hydrogenedentota bacterium]
MHKYGIAVTVLSLCATMLIGCPPGAGQTSVIDTWAATLNYTVNGGNSFLEDATIAINDDNTLVWTMAGLDMHGTYVLDEENRAVVNGPLVVINQDSSQTQVATLEMKASASGMTLSADFTMNATFRNELMVGSLTGTRTTKSREGEAPMSAYFKEVRETIQQ